MWHTGARYSTLPHPVPTNPSSPKNFLEFSLKKIYIFLNCDIEWCTNYIYSTIFIAYLFYIFLRKKILWNFSQFQYWCNCTLTTTLRKTMRQVDHLIPKSSLQAHSVCLMGKLWCSLSLSKNITQTNTTFLLFLLHT